MKRIKHIYWKVFLASLFIFFVFSALLFIDPYSPFSFVAPLQEMLFSDRSGELIFIIFAPGIRFAAFIVDPVFEPIVCPFFDGCPGRYDGSLVDSYFFFPLQGLVMSALYAGVITGVVYLVRRFILKKV